MTDSEKIKKHKEVIREFLRIFIVEINSDGNPTAPFSEIMLLVDKAKSLITEK